MLTAALACQILPTPTPTPKPTLTLKQVEHRIIASWADQVSLLPTPTPTLAPYERLYWELFESTYGDDGLLDACWSRPDVPVVQVADIAQRGLDDPDLNLTPEDDPIRRLYEARLSTLLEARRELSQLCGLP